jgi:membrane protein involved in colicin uptake
LIARREAGLNYGGKKDLEKLQAQQEMEDKSRQNAFDEIMSQGNNQQDFYDSLNQGSGSTAVSGNPNTSGAGDAPGYSGPTTFKYGGIVGLYR